MDDLLTNGLERLSDVLRVQSTTKSAFKLIVNIVEEILEFVKRQDKGITGSLRKPCASDVSVSIY